jgi:hypothetical protein
MAGRRMVFECTLPFIDISCTVVFGDFAIRELRERRYEARVAVQAHDDATTEMKEIHICSP